MARPKKEWTEKEWTQFEELCRILCSQGEICRVMGVTDKTLSRLVREHYGVGYQTAYRRFCADGKARLRKSQFLLAEKSATMAIWLGKQYLEQKDRQEAVTDSTITYVFENESMAE